MKRMSNSANKGIFWTIGAATALGILMIQDSITAQVVSNVVINEIMWDGEEYLELHNRSEESVPLTGWRLTRQQTADGAEDTLLTFEEGDEIPADGYFLMVKNEQAVSGTFDKVVSSLTLHNTGNLLRLYNGSGELADAANQLGAWYAGQNTETGVSMERHTDGEDGTDPASWFTSTASLAGRFGTPGAANSEIVLPSPTLSPSPSPEITPTSSPSASPTSSAIPSATPTPFPTPDFASIVINEFLPNPAGSDTEAEFIELTNIGVVAVDLGGWQIDDAEAGSKPYSIEPGSSISPGDFLVFTRSETGLALNNDGDQVRLISPDKVARSVASYAEAVPDNVSYNRTADGVYEKSTTVTAGAKNIITQPSPSPSPTPTENEEDEETFDISGKIYINEFLPNPTGSDTEAEFIELINKDSRSVNVRGWQLDDGEGGSRPYTIAEDTTIPAGGIISFPRSETGVALNNSDDAARLVDPNGKVVSSFAYDGSVPEGQSYNRTSEGTYVLSTTITEGKKNVITAPDGTAIGGGNAEGIAAIRISIEQIRAQEEGAVVTVEGVVSAPPHLLAKNVFYIAGSGVQVYVSSGEAADVSLGDKVRITGEVASIGGETRLKAAGADIEVTGTAATPAAHELETGGITEELEGTLVKLVGTVTRSSGSTFYIDDGSGEAKIVVQKSTGILKPKTSKGGGVVVTGIVSQTSSGYRVLPRYQTDLQVGAAPAASSASGRITSRAASTRAASISAAATDQATAAGNNVSPANNRMAELNSKRFQSAYTTLAVLGVGAAFLLFVSGVSQKEPLLQSRRTKLR